MFQVFEGETADSLWKSLTSSYLGGSFETCHKSRFGETHELLHVACSMRNPRQRWISLRRPAINVAFALAETVWIMRGRNDAKFLNHFNKLLPKFAGDTPIYHGAYGHRLRKQGGIDQLERAYLALSNNQQSRQVVLQIWNPLLDMPNEDGLHVSADVPCNVCSILKIRSGKLEWTQIMRSNDLFLGLPYNLVQFTTLQETLAGWLGVEVGGYNHMSDSLHVYERDSRFFSSPLPEEAPPNSDDLALPKEISDKSYGFLESVIESIIGDSPDIDELVFFATHNHLPQSFKNQCFIIVAEAIRRMGDRDLAIELANCGTNPLLISLYRNWENRVANQVK